ncbi:VCBS repeat-containing protein [Roseomonas sp. CECT 9278]|uniref:FG-GAP repeat domain-containing protein n=1 Tax=Roseomonas sp. CECT 9278 TaxID=2845823 RepID=UPI001E291A4A|nr:VCBS repeat-containing protein [Roseomonas sp. CECT 9278]CAH0149661.1 hypothetical protein ROS9278_00686 [Roseomonas sp. CECT 9278]
MPPSGLNTLSDGFVLGSDIETSSPFRAEIYNPMKESDSIGSSTAGNYASLTRADLVFAQQDGLHWREYDAPSNTFNGSVVFGADAGLDYIYTTDLNGDGFGDIVGFPLTTAVPGDPNSLYVTSFQGTPNAAAGAAPFINELYSYIPAGNMILEGPSDFLQVHDADFADFNGDGIMDIIVAGVNGYDVSAPSSGNDIDTYGCYAIGLGNGLGNFNFQPFQYNGVLAGGGNGSAGLTSGILARVTTGDFNGDGLVDVAFAYHPDDGDDIVTPNPTAFVVWGDAGSSSDAPILNTDSSNTYSNSWQNPQDVVALKPYPNYFAQLVITFDDQIHIAGFDFNKSLVNDNVIAQTPRGNLGTLLDYDLDGSPDIMVSDGESSAIYFGYDWLGTSGDYAYEQTGLTLGTDIANATGADFNGDGKPDFYGSYNDYLYAYENVTTPASSAVTLVEADAVAPQAVNGVAAAFMTGDGAARYEVSVVGGRTAQDNALGWFEMHADGTFGTARFIDLDDAAAGGVGLATPAAGARIALFLVANGAFLNGDLDGAFRFVDAETGDTARLGSTSPRLVRDGTGAAILGDIFHTLDANPFDAGNALNTGGEVQALSRADGAQSLLVAFEDLRFSASDADFNDLVLRVSVSTDLVL